MRFLALDLGTTTGWATFDGKLTTSGSQSFQPGRFEGGGMRYLKFQKWITTLHEQVAFEQVAFEEVRRHAGTGAAHIYGGFLASLTSWCEAYSVPYQAVPVGTIKKFWTGKGNAGKEVMIQAARERGFNPTDDNEADALAILYWMTTHAVTRPPDLRSAPDRQPKRRVPLEAVQVVKRRVRLREG